MHVTSLQHQECSICFLKHLGLSQDLKTLTLLSYVGLLDTDL